MQNLISNITDQILGQRPTVVPMQPNVDESRPMHSLVWMGSTDVQYVEKPRPVLTDSNDVILQITASSICGSDLHMYSGTLPNMKQGDILGHEFMGIVTEVGTSVQNIRQGQRVVVAFGIACGVCHFCQRKEFTACKTTNPSNLEKAQYGHRTAASMATPISLVVFREDKLNMSAFRSLMSIVFPFPMISPTKKHYSCLMLSLLPFMVPNLVASPQAQLLESGA